MDGIWANWLGYYKSVSRRSQALAAQTEKYLMDQIVDAEVVFGRVPREPFLKATALK